MPLRPNNDMDSMTETTAMELPIAPGAHIVVRDAEWRVVQVNPIFNGTEAYHVVGVSEIVRDQEAIFLQEYERTSDGKSTIEVLDPAITTLVEDGSSNHRAGLLYMESLLRDVPPTTQELHIGHEAAMDVLDFQLEPSRRALSYPRARILIADAVGLGKTLEAGILLSELIRRGRGRRILVVAVKSMLTQFQKELWTRFSIPLVRLDSVGLQRVRDQIPTNHNPFHHFDRAIISIDTLKQKGWFRTHVENARWDVIVIDEAHNVAVRGKGRSQRAQIAQLLADRSDELILLSATPHDGKARSFASLMHMLDPTAIANPDEYGPEDIEGLYIRRFKKDVQDEVAKAFPEREIARSWADATDTEEHAYMILAGIRFSRLDQRRSPGQLFKTKLEKALLSSPKACAKTIDNRVKRLEAREDAQDYASDLTQLKELSDAVEAIDAKAFGKYQQLLKVIKSKKHFGWKASKKEDRLVIFSEWIETVRFLEENLTRDLNLKKGQCEILHGGLPDTEQQRIVEEFGKESSKLRVLIASDVASEGLNLHYLCNKLIHFDIPWSLMKFRQRNGRIDRYGQERKPRIVYMLTKTEQKEIAGDNRILELLIDRDEQATKNIGDPSAFMGVYDMDEEERRTGEAIEDRLSPDQFEQKFGIEAFDPFELLLGEGQGSSAASTEPRKSPSLFDGDLSYLDLALDHLRDEEQVVSTVKRTDKLIELELPKDLERRFRRLPSEVLPKDKVVLLCSDAKRIQEEIKACRSEENAWPRLQYLWPLHPVVSWINDKMRFLFGRHCAPVLTVEGLEPGEQVVIVSGLLPNRRSQPLLHRWYGASFKAGKLKGVEELTDLLKRTKLGKKKLANHGLPADLETLQSLVPPAVEAVRQEILTERTSFETTLNQRLETEQERLEELRARQVAQLELDFEGKTGERATEERAARERQIERLFANFLSWVEDAMTTEPVPFLQVIAVLGSKKGA